jgi:transcriptional regulator with XRE-family HTH domain
MPEMFCRVSSRIKGKNLDRIIPCSFALEIEPTPELTAFNHWIIRMASADLLRTFGEKLRAARTEQQRSLSDIASAIKINRRHLEAIEAGDLSQLPQGPYVAAFVREYARAVGLTVPPEYAPVHAPATASPRDPKVVSRRAGRHNAGDASEAHEESGLSQMARETARFANTAVKGAVKTVTKTTESVVNLVETGGKEAFEVLTSKELWEEAENIRRERQGLPPIERPQEQAPSTHSSLNNRPEEAMGTATIAPFSSTSKKHGPMPLLGADTPVRTSRRATNMVIVSLAILFAGVAYLAIRMSRTQDGTGAISGYVPAPLEKQTPPVAARKPESTTPATSTLSSTAAVKDSLRFLLRATQPVWVSVAPDGIPAYRGELKAGDVRSFRAAQKFVVDLGNQKSVAMTLDGTPLSGLPAIQNSSVVVRNLVLMRDRVTLGGAPIDMSKLTSPVAPAAPSPLPTAIRGVPPPPIATRMEALAKKAKMDAIQKARSSASKNHPSSNPNSKPIPGSNSKTISASNSKTTPVKKLGKNTTIPQDPIHPVQPIPPGP